MLMLLLVQLLVQLLVVLLLLLLVLLLLLALLLQHEGDELFHTPICLSLLQRLLQPLLQQGAAVGSCRCCCCCCYSFFAV